MQETRKQEPLERVRRYVQAFDAALQPLVLAEEVKTSEAAARQLGVETGQIAKSLLFRGMERYGLIVAAGDVRISQSAVKQLLGGGKVKLAAPEEVLAVTGFAVGAVCPFALLQEVPIYLDRSLLRYELVYTAAGIAEAVLPITPAQLLAMTGATMVDVAQTAVDSATGGQTPDR